MGVQCYFAYDVAAPEFDFSLTFFCRPCIGLKLLEMEDVFCACVIISHRVSFPF